MKSRLIIILSNNFIFSNAVARFLQHKLFGFQNIKTVNFAGFFNEKILKEDKALLVIHAESFQLQEQLEMLKQYSFNVFAKIIIADSCMSQALIKFNFLPSKKVLNLSLNDNGLNIGKNFKSFINEIKSDQENNINELSNYLAVLRSLQFKHQFNEKQMELIRLLPFNYINVKMAGELHLSPRQYNRLQAEIASIAGVENTKQALYKYVIDKGILQPDPYDELL